MDAMCGVHTWTHCGDAMWVCVSVTYLLTGGASGFFYSSRTLLVMWVLVMWVLVNSTVLSSNIDIYVNIKYNLSRSMQCKRLRFS